MDPRSADHVTHHAPLLLNFEVAISPRQARGSPAWWRVQFRSVVGR